MARDILTYPTPLSAEYGTYVRKFDDELEQLLSDLKDTIEANGLDGLAAFQIGSYYNVVVVKDENGEYIEMVNPRVIRQSGMEEKEETTAYFPGVSAKIKRATEISVIYQDKEGNDKTLVASGDLGRLIQRKLDWNFGTSFVHKLSKEEKKEFEKKLDGNIELIAGGEYCPTTFVRDKFMKVANYIKLAMVLILIASFFLKEATVATLWNVQLGLSFGVVLFDIIYFFYGLHEAKIYKHCTSCQIGNFIGTVAISFIKLTVIMLFSYYFM